MNTIKKTITFNDDIDSLKLDPFRVFWESNETMEKMFIAIHDESAETTGTGAIDPLSLKSFGYEVNKSAFTPQTFTADQVITQKEAKLSQQRIAIYQFALPFTNFTAGENTITLYEMVKKGVREVKNLIGKISFFLKEESNVTNVKLDRPGIEPTTDQVLWDAINNHFLKFSDYETFIDKILCADDSSVKVNGQPFERLGLKKRSPFIKSEEYNLIKFATDFYMMSKLGLDTSALSGYAISGKIPYYNVISDRIKDDIALQVSLSGDCGQNELSRLSNPVLIELIWNYWMEQGMLVQTLNVINLRFQNIKGNNYADRLQRFDADPLRPLSHILWGYIQDEQHRLSIPRRLNEYDHEYGLTLTGRAIPRIAPVDTRVKFLEAFHNLLTLCTIYYKEPDDTTRIADAFPILNALKEVHLLLAEGNHNAYGNLTWTARQEMMMQQYILSRPEMREFLGGRVMVPYPETWMDRVDTMRNLQGWGGTGIVYYHELASHGEMILLSIRYGNWSDITLNRNHAANWAQSFRNSVQRYIHAYRSVTGVDMSVDQIMKLPSNFAIQPAYLIQERLQDERARTRRA